MKMKRLLLLCAICAIIFVLLCGCSSDIPANTVHSDSELAGKSVGVLEGSVTESYLAEYSGEMNLKSFTEAESLSSELISGGLDAVIADSLTAKSIMSSSKITKLDTPLIDREYCIAVSQENKTLLENINGALNALEQEGTLKALIDGWLYGTYDGHFDEKSCDSTLVIAVCPDFWPYAFYDENGNLTGLEIDLARLICEKLQVNAEFREVTADRLVYMTESGKVSLSIGRITRGDAAVLYSDTYLTSVQDILVRKD